MVFFKLIYLELFYLYYGFLKLFTGCRTKAWVRNSLLQDYFSFGRSDLDLTIFFPQNSKFISKSLASRKIARYFFLIKEINYYCPFTIKQSADLINLYEWKRDPKLHKFITRMENDNPSCKLVYFLRMILSQKDIYKKLENRDFKKWNFHFKNIGIDYPLFAKDCAELLIYMLNLTVPELKKDFIEKIIAGHNSIVTNMPLRNLIFNKEDEHLFLTYFPQAFCFLNVEEMKLDIFSANVLRHQTEWEVWGMMSQPWLFQSEEGANQHLKNLVNILKKTKSYDGKTIPELNQLIQKIENFEAFLKEKS